MSEQSVAALLAMDVYDGVDPDIPRSSFELPFKIFEEVSPESSDDGFSAAAYSVGGKSSYPIGAPTNCSGEQAPIFGMVTASAEEVLLLIKLRMP